MDVNLQPDLWRWQYCFTVSGEFLNNVIEKAMTYSSSPVNRATRSTKAVKNTVNCEDEGPHSFCNDDCVSCESFRVSKASMARLLSA